MQRLDQLFDRMDAWRHFPSYQLERRADLFFSLYLGEVLAAEMGFPLRAELIPEFPIRIGTIYPDLPSDKSYKLDYLALSETGQEAILVELKTEGLSRRVEQDAYLNAARQAGLPLLLEGVLDIFRATQAKRKYFCLLEALAEMGLLHIPGEVSTLMTGTSLQGIGDASRHIQVTAPDMRCRVVYVQPRGEGDDVINFHTFAQVVRRHEDPLSQRFAASLEEWATLRAGAGPRGQVPPEPT